MRPTCVRENAIYIEPHKVGNSTPMPERIRITLDCFDQVRRNYPTDPDRTYIAGYSGGGNVAPQMNVNSSGPVLSRGMTNHAQANPRVP